MPPGSVRSSASLRNLFDLRPLFRKQPLDRPSAGQDLALMPLCQKQRVFPQKNDPSPQHNHLANHPLNRAENTHPKWCTLK